MVEHSSTERYLKGKRVPVDKLTGSVKQVVKKDGARVITDRYGHKVTVSKQQLLAAFNASLASNQKRIMMKTIRVMKDETATVRIGGIKKGVTKHYVSKAAAIAALNRRYGKAEKGR